MIKVANAILVMMVMMVMMVVGILGQCETPQQFIPKGQTKCQYVECRNDDHCQDYAQSCSKNTEMFCLYNGNAGYKICSCRGQWTGDRYGNGSCNFHLNGNSKCNNGQVCADSGRCIADPKCAMRVGDTCGPNRGCCSELFCHKSKDQHYSCQNVAQVDEDCKSGIPCVGSSHCINGKCSKEKSGACTAGDVCPPLTECKETSVGAHVYYNCACISTGSMGNCVSRKRDGMWDAKTLIMQIKPRELVTEKVNDTVTADEIRIGGYFSQASGDIDMKSDDDWLPVHRSAAQTPILLSAVGGLIWYLRSNTTSLILDGQTLAKLEIFKNSLDGSAQGTIFKLLANSITPFGKRLFKRWLCHPLRRVKDIGARQDAVEDLIGALELQDRLGAVFASLLDLERLISRVHSKRCTMAGFLTTLDGFEKAR
ncbi:hypothetical protein [Absidia glauca]|uniref:DNA mismatch repair protein MutS core domain-containing protein n=1 Tax=Absidia glauca TaxID=4829 RepID=A0A163JW10_ABSGL|nr:hypothetical protein [Absidia glauca]